jgi:hypothetical protein
VSSQVNLPVKHGVAQLANILEQVFLDVHDTSSGSRIQQKLMFLLKNKNNTNSIPETK